MTSAHGGDISTMLEIFGIVAAIVVAVVVLAKLIRRYTIRYTSPINYAVLITGCDSGFGQKMAHAFHRRGFVVFAGCLTQHGVDEYTDLIRVYAFVLDITRDSSVSAAAKVVRSTCSLHNYTLHALINNAGVHDGWRVEFTELEVYQRLFNVNTLGHIRVTQQFLPQLCKRPDSRIVFTSSLSAVVPLAGFSAYSASKAATSAFATTVRRELGVFGTWVCQLEPGGNRTGLVEKMGSRIRHMISNASYGARNMFDSRYYDAFIETVSNKSILMSGDQVVADAVHAVTARWPYAHYPSGYDSLLLRILYQCIPYVEWFDALVTYPRPILRQSND